LKFWIATVDPVLTVAREEEIVEKGSEGGIMEGKGEGLVFKSPNFFTQRRIMITDV